MPNIIDIHQKAPLNPENLPVISYHQQRVITTELLAQGYGSEVNNIRNNFKRNHHRFIEGKHYYRVENEELDDLRISFSDAQISNKTRSLILWTERGASRHAKMLETDQAWDFYEKLEESYFNLARPKTQAEMNLAYAQVQVEQERKINALAYKVDQVANQVEQMNKGIIPAGWQGFSVLHNRYGLSHQKCRTLVASYDIENKPITFIAPGGIASKMTIVHEGFFVNAFYKMMNEAEKRGTRWNHPKMGTFSVIGWEVSAPMPTKRCLPTTKNGYHFINPRSHTP